MLRRLLALLAISLSGCIDTIQLDLNSARSAIVIDAQLTDADEANEVVITQTVDFATTHEFPPVTDARVVVQDLTTGVADTLAQPSPGVYRITKISGVPGHQYRLTVRLDQNTYTAFATMPARVAFDQLSYQTGSRFNNQSIQMVASFQDPPQPGNYYRFVNYQNRLPSRTFFARSDGFTNGNRISQVIRDENIAIVKGDTMTVEMQCIEKGVYDYINGLSQLQGNNLNQGTAPTNPPSNLSGGALGYFSAHTVQRRSLVIQ